MVIIQVILPAHEPAAVRLLWIIGIGYFIALLFTFRRRGPAESALTARDSGYAAPIPAGSMGWELIAALRALRLIVLSGLVFIVQYKMGCPWDDGCQTYIWLNVALGMLVVMRMIGWPSYLGLVFLSWYLAAANWPRN